MSNRFLWMRTTSLPMFWTGAILAASLTTGAAAFFPEMGIAHTADLKKASSQAVHYQLKVDTKVRTHCQGIAYFTSQSAPDIGTVAVEIGLKSQATPTKAHYLVLKQLSPGVTVSAPFSLPAVKCPSSEVLDAGVVFAQDTAGKKLANVDMEEASLRTRGDERQDHAAAAAGNQMARAYTPSLSSVAAPEIPPSPKEVQEPASAPNKVGSASFDCGLAQTEIELAICQNKELREIDGEMGRLYKEAIKAEKIDRTRQINWLKLRDQTCLGSERIDHCIFELTERRVSYLRDVAEGTGWSISRGTSGLLVAQVQAEDFGIDVGCINDGAPGIAIFSDRRTGETTDVVVRVDGKPIVSGGGETYQQDGRTGLLLTINNEQLSWLRRGTRAGVAFNGKAQGDVSLNGSDKAIASSLEECGSDRVNSAETKTSQDQKAAFPRESVDIRATQMGSSHLNPLLGAWNSKDGKTFIFTEKYRMIDSRDRTQQLFSLNISGDYLSEVPVRYEVNGNFVTVTILLDDQENTMTAKYLIKDDETIERLPSAAAWMNDGREATRESAVLKRRHGYMPKHFDLEDPVLVAFNTESVRVLAGACTGAFSEKIVEGAKQISERVMLTLPNFERNIIKNTTNDIPRHIDGKVDGCRSETVRRRIEKAAEATQAAIEAHRMR